eukprot:TRINITY_DN21692_c0_g1_i1.p1 TRINITY_DN21692_c0_g1~~TRINITY_DN21692_c0_g1_i1.p1  ORF type:complete len:485 (-),score=92.48 TRINITY_DN21692_c0_g1_i1:14-1468(-)
MQTKHLLLCVLIVAPLVLSVSFPQGDDQFLDNQPRRFTLPGYRGPPVSQYAGFIDVGEQSDRHLFYWFVESQRSPSSDPLVVWFQGGPGCSGLFGLFAENGPYIFDDTRNPAPNDISWNKISNVLYVEAPVGVGFSYTDDGVYNINDNTTAWDNYHFLEKWLQLFPQYQRNQLWLTGESYAGVYIPTLTRAIFENPTSLAYRNFAGVMVGNPVISCPILNYQNAQFMNYYYHGLVSFVNFANWTRNNCDKNSNTVACNQIFNLAQAQIGAIDQEAPINQQPSLDPDDLYQDFCTGNGTLDFILSQGYPTQCSTPSDLLTTYLNRADVQQVLGVNKTVWISCNSNNNFNYTTSGESMIPLYIAFAKQRPAFKILIYSGDVDIATVPFVFTHACLSQIPGRQTVPWQPWFVNGATAGYFEQYPIYTYATVKGAGHEAPKYQPFISYKLFERFMTSGTLKGDQEIRKHQRSTHSQQSDMLRKYRILA